MSTPSILLALSSPPLKPGVGPRPAPAEFKHLLNALPQEEIKTLNTLRNFTFATSGIRDEYNPSLPLLSLNFPPFFSFHYHHSHSKRCQAPCRDAEGMGEERMMEVIPYLLERRPRHPFPAPSPTLDAARVKTQEESDVFADGFRALDKELRARQPPPPSAAPSTLPSAKPKKKATSKPYSRPKPSPFSPLSSPLTQEEELFRLSQHISVASFTSVRDHYLSGLATLIGAHPKSTERKFRIRIGLWLVERGRMEMGWVDRQRGSGGSGGGRKREGSVGKGKGRAGEERAVVEEREEEEMAERELMGEVEEQQPISSLSSIPTPSLPYTSSSSSTTPTKSSQIIKIILSTLSSNPTHFLPLSTLYLFIHQANPTLFPIENSAGWKGILRTVLSREDCFVKGQGDLWGLRK